jgi:hypothetical protein
MQNANDVHCTVHVRRKENTEIHPLGNKSRSDTKGKELIAMHFYNNFGFYDSFILCPEEIPLACSPSLLS